MPASRYRKLLDSGLTTSVPITNIQDFRGAWEGRKIEAVEFHKSPEMAAVADGVLNFLEGMDSDDIIMHMRVSDKLCFLHNVRIGNIYQITGSTSEEAKK